MKTGRKREVGSLRERLETTELKQERPKKSEVEKEKEELRGPLINEFITTVSRLVSLCKTPCV